MPPKGPEWQVEWQQANELGLEKLNTEDLQNIGELFDKKQEIYPEQEYDKHKQNVIANIVTWKLNKDYLTVDPNNTTYKNSLFINEEPTRVRWYLAYYNSQQLEAKLRKLPYDPTIDIDKFMNNFAEEQQTKTPDKQRKNPQNIPFETQKQQQRVGEFPVDWEHVTKIYNWVTDIMNSWQQIDKLIVSGNADATRITLDGKSKVITTYGSYRNLLINKWRTKNLPDERLLDNLPDEGLQTQEQQNKLNEWYAWTRALMQLAFLDEDQLSYIQNHMSDFVFNVRAENVDLTGTNKETKKWDQYTWWGIEMELQAGSKILKEPLLAKKETLIKMINNRTINFAIRWTMPQSSQEFYNTVGTIHVSVKDGKLNALAENRTNTPQSISTRYHTFPRGAEKKQIFLEQNNNVNTMWIMLDNNDPRINIWWIGMKWLENNIQSFYNALNEYGSNTTDQEVSSYIEETKSVLQTYEAVDQALKDAEVTKKISL